MADKYDNAGLLVRPVVMVEDMENEILRNRLAEMAAEVERLQGLIDAANAQEPVKGTYWRDGSGVFTQSPMDSDLRLYLKPIPAQQSIEQAHMAGQADAGVDPSYSNAQAYAISFGSQQSPAVAVPDEGLAFNNWSWTLDEDSDVFNDPSSATKAAWMERAKLCQSPRITERDFIEIIKSCMQVTIPFNVSFESWMSAEGRSLLDKLNGVKG